MLETEKVSVEQSTFEWEKYSRLMREKDDLVSRNDELVVENDAFREEVERCRHRESEFHRFDAELKKKHDSATKLVRELTDAKKDLVQRLKTAEERLASAEAPPDERLVVQLVTAENELKESKSALKNAEAESDRLTQYADELKAELALQDSWTFEQWIRAGIGNETAKCADLNERFSRLGEFDPVETLEAYVNRGLQKKGIADSFNEIKKRLETPWEESAFYGENVKKYIAAISNLEFLENCRNRSVPGIPDAIKEVYCQNAERTVNEVECRQIIGQFEDEKSKYHDKSAQEEIDKLAKEYSDQENRLLSIGAGRRSIPYFILYDESADSISLEVAFPVYQKTPESYLCKELERIVIASAPSIGFGGEFSPKSDRSVVAYKCVFGKDVWDQKKVTAFKDALIRTAAKKDSPLFRLGYKVRPVYVELGTVR